MQSFSFIHQMFYDYDKFDDLIWEKLQKYIYSKTKCTGPLWEMKKNGMPDKSPNKYYAPDKSFDVDKSYAPDTYEKEKNKNMIESPLHKQSDNKPSVKSAPTNIEPIIESKQGSQSLSLAKTEKMFEPSYTNDTIFWCIFQYVYGERELEIIKGNTAIRMIEEKQKIMEWLQKHPKIMKSSNVKFTNDRISSVISEFMCAKGESSFLMIAAYAMYYKIRIFLVDEKRKIYLRFFPEFDSENDAFCILYKNPKSKSAKAGAKYCCRFRDRREKTEKEEFDELFNTKCELVQYDKPLNGQTQYGVADLEIMANKLDIPLEDENGKKIKKGDLYKKIWEKMEWQM